MTKDIETGKVTNTPASDVYKTKHLVYNTTTKQFVPIVHNARTGTTKRYMLFKKNVLGVDKPMEDLFITSGHKILHKGEIIKAGKIPGKVIHNLEEPDRLYTIVTDDGCPIWINGLDVMTYNREGFDAFIKKKSITWKENK